MSYHSSYHETMGEEARCCAAATESSQGRVVTIERHRVISGLLAILLGLAASFFQTVPRTTEARAERPAARLIAVLDPGKRPEPVIVDPSRHRVYIGTETGGSITVVNDRTNRIVKTIHVGREVEDLAFDQASGLLYAVSSVRSRLSVVNTITLRVVAVVGHLKHASGVALDPSRHRVYVTETKALAVLNTSNTRVIQVLPMAGDPLGIGVDTRLHRVFVGLFMRHRVEVIDESTNRITGSIQVGNRPVHPFHVDSSAHRLYLLNSGSSTLSVVDTRTLRVLRTLKTAQHPEGLDVWPGTNRVYVSNEGDPGTDRNSGHTASVINLRTGRIIDTLATLQGPDGIAYDPNTAIVYVSNEDPGRVSVIRVPPRDR